MKYVLIYTSFLMLVFHTSCGQNQTEVKKNTFTTLTNKDGVALKIFARLNMETVKCRFFEAGRINDCLF